MRDIASLPIRLCAFVVDKEKLYGAGFRYSDSFHKYLHRKFYNGLVIPFPTLQIIADERGNEELMMGFKGYIEERCFSPIECQTNIDFGDGSFIEASPPERGTFRFASSADEVLVQVADFVAGSLARCFDADFKTEERSDFLAALDPILAGITHWPLSHTNQSPLTNLQSEGIHPVIYEHSLRAAGRFLTSSEDNRSPSLRAQSACLRRLLAQIEHLDPHRYLSKSELMKYIETPGDVSDPDRFFRTSVIAKLKDADVCIVACSKGYKLPVKESDVIQHLQHQDATITPMIMRQGKYLDQLKLQSGGEIDIYALSDFRHLALTYRLLERGVAPEIQPALQEHPRLFRDRQPVSSRRRTKRGTATLPKPRQGLTDSPS